MGGFITFTGVWRVAGVLATSRALGDFPLKEPRKLVTAGGYGRGCGLAWIAVGPEADLGFKKKRKLTYIYELVNVGVNPRGRTWVGVSVVDMRA